MIILIPFQLLKLQSLLSKNRSKENLEALKNLIQNDIIGSINENLVLRNITVEDSQRLRCLTHKLYQHIYSHYDEMEVLNEMTDESLILDVDIVLKDLHEKLEAEYEQKYQQLYEQKYQQLYEQKYQQRLQEELAGKDAEIAEKNAALAQKEAEKAATDAENARLRAQIEALRNARK